MMNRLVLVFVLVTIACIQCVPMHVFNDSSISNVPSHPMEVVKKVDVQWQKQDQLKTSFVQSTISPNELSIYYKWLAFFKSSTSTIANDVTNQPQRT